MAQNLSLNLSLPAGGVAMPDTDPFERTLDRIRARRESDTFRQGPRQYLPTGFSADGLSYSRGEDVGANLAEALERYEARVENPRFIPGAAEPNPDSEAMLRREILDPLEQEFPITGARTNNRRARVFQSGGRLLEYDPLTRRVETIWTNPDKADKSAAAPTVDVPDTKSEISNWFATNPLMQAEEAAALEALKQPGANPLEILGERHPTLLKNAPYSTKFLPVYQRALRESLKTKPIKETKIPTTSQLAGERSAMERAMAAKGLPPHIASVYRNRILEIDKELAAGPNMPDAGELVRVKKSDGSTVRINKSDLEKALASGDYTLP